MKKTIVLVGEVDRSQWIQKVQGSLEDIATIELLTKEDVFTAHHLSDYDLAIIDSSTIQRELIEILKKLKESQPTAQHLIITASPTWRRARDVFKAGADDYLKQMEAKKLVKLCSELLLGSMMSIIALQ